MTMTEKADVDIPDFKGEIKKASVQKKEHFWPRRNSLGKFTVQTIFVDSMLGQLLFLGSFLCGAFLWGKADDASYKKFKVAEKARMKSVSMKGETEKIKKSKEQVKWEGDTANLPKFDDRKLSLNMVVGYFNGKTPEQRAKEKEEAEEKARAEEEALAKAEAEQKAKEEAAMPQMPQMPGMPGAPGAGADPQAMLAQLSKGGGMPGMPGAGAAPAPSQAWKAARKESRLAGGTGLAKGVGRGFDSAPVGKGSSKLDTAGAFYASNAQGGQTSATFNPNAPSAAATPAPVAAPAAASPVVQKPAKAAPAELLAETDAPAADSDAGDDGEESSAVAGGGAAPRKTAAVGRAASARTVSARGRAIASKQMPKSNRNFKALESKLGQTAKLAGKAGGSGPDESGSLMAGQSFDNSTGEGVVEGADSKKKMMGDLIQGEAAESREESVERRTRSSVDNSASLAPIEEEESKALTTGAAWDSSQCEDGEIPDPSGKPECVDNILASKPATDPSAGYAAASRGASMIMGGALALQFLLNVMMTAPLTSSKLKTKRVVQGGLVVSALASAGFGAILMGMGNTWAGLPFAVTGPLIAAGAWFAYPAVAGMSLLSVSSVPGALMSISIPFMKRDKEDKRVKRSLAFAD